MTESAQLAPAQARLPWRMAEVVEVVTETPRTRSLVFRLEDWPGHIPGQHVDLRLTGEDGYQAQRSYSIASPPERRELVLTVERIEGGEVSPYLTDEVRPGDVVELRGPIGGYFTWSASLSGPLLLVAGGSGVVPLMCMLRHRAHRPSPAPARLLYSSRAFDAIIYRGELDDLVKGDGGLVVVHTLTRESPPDWTGLRRRVDAEMLRACGFAPDQNPRIYICGPTPFVESVADALLGLGHAPVAIKTERFGPTGAPG